MQRGRRRRGKSEDQPRPRERYVRRKAPFQRANLPANSPHAALNLFHSVQTKLLPGTLHHSGNKPAPPSDHTPLARRSAFAPAETEAGREFGPARGVETHTARGSAVPAARLKAFVSTQNHETLRFHSRYCRGNAGDFYADRSRKARGSGRGNVGSATWSARERPEQCFLTWPRAASS